MSGMLPYIDKQITFNLADVVNAVKQNIEIMRDKDYFKPNGIHVFFGEQGSGKTLTAKRVVDEILKDYPKALLVSNVGILDRKPLIFNESPDTLLNYLKSDKLDTTKYYIQFGSMAEYEMVVKYVKRDKYGVLFFVDEIQNYFNNQESKNVPMWVIEQSAQLRKQRKAFIVTSQDFDQIAKPIRRRTHLAMKCATFGIPFLSYGSIFTTIKVFNSKDLDWENGKMIGNKLKIGWFFHTRKLRDSFDTLQVIFTGKEGTDLYTEESIKIQNELKLKLKR